MYDDITQGIRNRILHLIFAAVLLVSLWAAAKGHASVTLVPRVDSSGNIADEAVVSEDHVYWGTFKHRLLAFNGAKETTATGMLWPAKSVDLGTSPPRAIFLAHHVVDAMAYQSASRTPRDRNTWAGSDLQSWLNAQSEFLADFTARESDAGAMLQMDEVSGLGWRHPLSGM